MAIIDVDADIRSSDWIKSTSWSFTEISSLEDLLSKIAGNTVDKSTQVQILTDFMALPAADSMPDELRKEVYSFIGQDSMSPLLRNRLLWVIKTVDKFFPEEADKVVKIYKKIEDEGINFFSDMDFEDQAVLLEFETRDISDKSYPPSPLSIEISRAAKLRK